MFTEALANRFVNDYKLPIEITTDEKQFMYEIKFFEESHNSQTLWDKLIKLINDEYKGNPELFLADYYVIRNLIIEDVTEHNNAYKAYCDSDIIRQKISGNNYPKTRYNSIYNQETSKSGKLYMSFDLKSANYQIFKREGILNYPTYKAFIANYTSGGIVDYIADSKYFRQVIFGKMNPGRTTKYEKALMNDVFNAIKEVYPDVECLVMNADEIIIASPEDDIIHDKIIKHLNDVLQNTLHLDIRIEYFMIEGYEYFVDNKKIGEMYRRTCDGKYHLRCVNQHYLKLIHKAYKNLEPAQEDYVVKFDTHCTAILTNKITLKRL